MRYLLSSVIGLVGCFVVIKSYAIEAPMVYSIFGWCAVLIGIFWKKIDYD